MTLACTTVPVADPENEAEPGNADAADAGPGVNAARNPAAVSTATASAATRVLTRVLLLPMWSPGVRHSPSPSYLYLRTNHSDMTDICPKISRSAPFRIAVCPACPCFKRGQW